MLDFQRGPKPRNFLARREQWRLLLLVLMLGLVVIFAFEARKPEHYRWLLAEGESGAGRAAAGKPSGVDRPVDTRARTEAQPEEIPGTFLSPGRVEADDGVTSSRYFPGVQPSLLESVRDNKPLGHSEWEAWFHLFDVLKKNDVSTLERASTGWASFIQLFEQSREYRGELVTTRGIIRRAHPAKAPANDYGLVDYYQTWLWPADHPTDPIVVWCLYLPEGFPTGMEIAEEAEVTGFSFKLWAYKAADGNVRRAPMLLARTVRWQKKPQVAQTSPQGPLPVLLMIAGSAAFAVLVAVYVYSRTRRRGPLRVESPVRLDVLRDVEAPADVGPTQKELADSEDSHGP